MSGEKEIKLCGQRYRKSFIDKNRDVMLFKYRYCDVDFKTIQIVIFGATGNATRTRSHEAFFNDENPGILLQKKKDLLKLSKKNLIPAGYLSFYNSLGVSHS